VHIRLINNLILKNIHHPVNSGACLPQGIPGRDGKDGTPGLDGEKASSTFFSSFCTLWGFKMCDAIARRHGDSGFLHHPPHTHTHTHPARAAGGERNTLLRDTCSPVSHGRLCVMFYLLPSIENAEGYVLIAMYLFIYLFVCVLLA